MESTVRYKDTFVRVFDGNRNKIAKGNIATISENTLRHRTRKDFIEIPMDQINHIKTKHSPATNVLVGALGGVVIVILTGVATADEDGGSLPIPEPLNALMGGLTGGSAEAGIGSLTLLFRKGNVYHIQGRESAWEYFRDSMKKKTSYKQMVLLIQNQSLNILFLNF